MLVEFNERRLEELEWVEWTKELSKPIEVDWAHMKYLLENPPVLCSDQTKCVSKFIRDKSMEQKGTEEECRCIRTLFPHRTHYIIYKELLKNSLIEDFVEVITETSKKSSTP